MKSVQRPGRQATDPAGDSTARALDRFEDEGGPGPEDGRDRRRDGPTSAPPGDAHVVDPGRIVVKSGSTAAACQVHHRDIPALHADGATPRAAAANLIQDLAREVEGVADHFRCDPFTRALDDARAFAAPGPRPPTTGEHSDRDDSAPGGRERVDASREGDRRAMRRSDDGDGA